MIENKWFNGTNYHIKCPAGLCIAIDSVIDKNIKVRIFYGVNGVDSLVTYYIVGYIRRISSESKIPLLAETTSSTDGAKIKTNNIVKITIIDDGKILYQHPNYRLGRFNIWRMPENKHFPELQFALHRDGVVIKYFKEEITAAKYITFLEGKINSMEEEIGNRFINCVKLSSRKNL